ncbi:MAG: hypothetical protein QOH63_2081 [Acidobacteriota bacterium]|jgi:hypothetical protein|nr:hypothetical protein [Acidobacteriota bacterium]
MKIRKEFLGFLVLAFVAMFVSHVHAQDIPPTPQRQRPEKNKIAVMIPDLTIMSALQTEPDFWIVKVKNIGTAEAGASKLKVFVSIPQSSGGFPGGVVEQLTFDVQSLKAGGITYINVKTKTKTKPGMTVAFSLNPDHTVKEKSYDNNSKSEAANPSYK